MATFFAVVVVGIVVEVGVPQATSNTPLTAPVRTIEINLGAVSAWAFLGQTCKSTVLHRDRLVFQHVTILPRTRYEKSLGHVPSINDSCER
jgi:hypothetical protein